MKADQITKLTFGRVFLDLDPIEETESEEANQYLIFVRDRLEHEEHYKFNKMSMVLVNGETGYVINNDIEFEHLHVEDDKFIFKRYNFMTKQHESIEFWKQ